MATSKSDLQKMVDDYLGGTYETYRPRDVPEPTDIPLGKKAASMDTTALFIDIRQSSDITNTFRRQTAAKMLKSYFHGAVKVISANGGKVRSFNGDGMLALFVGNRRSNNAAMAAFQVEWFVTELLRPKFDRLFDGNDAARGQRLGNEAEAAALLDDYLVGGSPTRSPSRVRAT